MYVAQDTLRAEVQNLLNAGIGVVGLDLFMQGEFVTETTPQPVVNRINADGADANSVYAGYTYGYNEPLFAQRTQDVLTAVSYLVNHERSPKGVHLIGCEGAGPIALAARALAGGDVALAAVDVHGFQFGDINTLNHADFLPGAVKYGDVAALATLNAPLPLWVSDESKQPSASASAAYRLSGVSNLIIKAEPSDRLSERTGQAAKWLLDNAQQ